MINLLPAYRQKKLRREEMSKIAAIIGIVFFAAFLAFILMMALIHIDYSEKLKKAEINLEGKKQEMEIFAVDEIESQIARNNSLISKINEFYEKQVKITKIFLQIAEAMPLGLTISRFTYVSSKIMIEGYAPDRNALAVFKNNLENQSGFFEVNFPSENWLAPQNINFNVNFKYVRQ